MFLRDNARRSYVYLLIVSRPTKSNDSRFNYDVSSDDLVIDYSKFTTNRLVSISIIPRQR